MILVSACLIGVNCKYNGKNNLDSRLKDFLKDKDYIAVCPEALSGLGTPRTPVEIVGDRVLTAGGKDCTDEFNKGIEKVLEQIDISKVEYAVLQSRSPSCGVNRIYDGTFSGKLIDGKGVFSKALEEKNVKIFDIEDFFEK